MRINGVSLGPIEFVIIAVAIAFLFSMMGKRRCSGGGAKFVGFVMVMLAVGAVVFALKSHRSVVKSREGVQSHEEFGFAQGWHGDEWEGVPMHAFPQVNTEFAHEHGQDLVNCQAVFLPPDEDGNTLVRVAVDVDPQWRIFALGRPRDRSAIHSVSQLKLAQADWKYKIAGSPRPESEPLMDGPFLFHNGRVIWTMPIRLERGVDADKLQVRGTVLAQLMKDGMPVPVDRQFVATLAAADDLLTNLDPPGQIEIHQQVAAQSNSNSNSNNSSNTESNTENAAAGVNAQVAEDVPAPPQQVDNPNPAPDAAVPVSTELPVYAVYPYNDPAYDEEAEKKERGSWIKGAQDYKAVDSSAFYTTVRTEAHHKNNLEGRLEEFRQQVQARVNHYIDYELLERGASRHVNLSYAEIRDKILKVQYTEPGDTAIDDGGNEMDITYGRLVFTPEVNEEIRERYKNEVVGDRIGFFGVIAGMCLAFVATIYGYFRVDTATKGYYSGRLKIAAIAICILILGAGSGILEEFGRHGF